MSYSADSIERMRAEIKPVYPGLVWSNRVDRMRDDQVFAVWNRFCSMAMLDHPGSTDHRTYQISIDDLMKEEF